MFFDQIQYIVFRSFLVNPMILCQTKFVVIAYNILFIRVTSIYSKYYNVQIISNWLLKASTLGFMDPLAFLFWLTSLKSLAPCDTVSNLFSLSVFGLVKKLFAIKFCLKVIYNSFDEEFFSGLTATMVLPTHLLLSLKWFWGVDSQFFSCECIRLPTFWMSKPETWPYPEMMVPS